MKIWLEEARSRKTKNFPFKGKLCKWKRCKRRDVEIVGESITYKGNADYIRAIYIPINLEKLR